jgi:hypothetical protein
MPSAPKLAFYQEHTQGQPAWKRCGTQRAAASMKVLESPPYVCKVVSFFYCPLGE